jgi:hypothetical protein
MQPNRVNLRYPLFLIILILILVSCIKNIDLNTGEFIKQPVVNAIICAGDTAKIYLSYSFPSYKEITFEKIDSAFIQITDSKNSIFTFNQYNSYYHHGAAYKSILIPSVNETYNLNIEIDGFNSISSTTIIPNPTSIDSLCFNVIPNDNEEGSKLQLITWFKDPLAQNFYYYRFSVIGGEWQPFWIDSLQDYRIRYVYNQELFDLYWETSDPLLGEANKFMKNKLTVFSDQLINNMSYDIKFSIPINNSSVIYDHDTIMIYSFLYTISSDFYYYTEALNQQYASSGNPFAEPVPDYTNINNARGIFAGISVSIDSVKIATNNIKKI